MDDAGGLSGDELLAAHIPKRIDIAYDLMEHMLEEEELEMSIVYPDDAADEVDSDPGVDLAPRTRPQPSEPPLLANLFDPDFQRSVLVSLRESGNSGGR